MRIKKRRVPRTEAWSAPTFRILTDVICTKIFNNASLKKLSAQNMLVFIIKVDFPPQIFLDLFLSVS